MEYAEQIACRGAIGMNDSATNFFRSYLLFSNEVLGFLVQDRSVDCGEPRLHQDTAFFLDILQAWQSPPPILLSAPDSTSGLGLFAS